MNPINHVAIIMDGNGRWGIKNKGSRNLGHRAGLDTIERIIEETINQNISHLTLYTFSTENWKRPKTEVSFLFELLENFLSKKISNLIKNKIRLKIIGNRKKFSNKLLAAFLIVTAIDISAFFYHNFIQLPLAIEMLRIRISSFKNPLLFLYILSVIYGNFKLQKKHLVHLLPWLVHIIVFIPNFFWLMKLQNRPFLITTMKL